MINANELRIGNFFWEGYGGYKIVTAINSNNVGEMKNSVSAKGLGATLSGQYSLDEIQPIPLTHDILVKCGFRHSEKNGYFYLVLDSQGIIAIEHDDFSIFLGDNFEELGFAGNKKSCVNGVHQLQNLYFTLTGEELNVQL